ncbi:MAG: cytochrome c biogenesis protein CcsA [Candidatus Dormibacteraeota bacterium]|nr:cytochrome c biogenesis protein CcsA [Candidatus Dormibacteraeota bacterium]
MISVSAPARPATAGDPILVPVSPGLRRLGGLTLVVLLFSTGLAFLYAPPDVIQGQAQRIFYFHVPLAWVAYLAFFLVLVGSAGYLWHPQARWDRLAHAAAELGLVLTTLVLITGSLWGKTIWGTWWSWDPRLTATLVLWFIYLGYGMIRSLTVDPERGRRWAAVLGIVGFVDVPIVHQSVVWWRSLHPAPVVLSASGPQLPASMLLTLLVNLLAYTLLFGWLLLWRMRIARMEAAVADAQRHVAFMEE